MISSDDESANSAGGFGYPNGKTLGAIIGGASTNGRTATVANEDAHAAECPTPTGPARRGPAMTDTETAVASTKAPSEARTHLTALAVILRRRGWKAEVVEVGGLALRVVNPVAPVMSERISCTRVADHSWRYAWPWREPIAPVDHATRAADIIINVLRAIECEPDAG